MVTGIRVWGNGLEWILLTTCPVAEVEDALRITGWYAVRRTVEEFHKAWKTGCRAAPAGERGSADPQGGSLAILAVRLLALPDEARRDRDPPSEAPASAIQILSLKLKRPPASFSTRRRSLRGVAQLGGFLARKADGAPGWQTIGKAWMRLMAMIEAFEMAIAVTEAKCA